jgi:hypothetical protein
MLSKSRVRKIIASHLHGDWSSDNDEAEELADELVDILDEEGLFETQDIDDADDED